MLSLAFATCSYIDYFEIDLEVVWSVVDQDLPRLVAAVDWMTHVARNRQL